MASVNKCIIIGNLGNDPQTQFLPSGAQVTTISVATTDKWKDKNSGEMQEKTEWHRIKFFNRLAEIVAEYMAKGSHIYVEGRLQTQKWTDKTGADRYTTEIIGQEMKMLGNPARSSTAATHNTPLGRSQNQPRPAASGPDDVPF